jgi:homoserine trans-succinylase
MKKLLILLLLLSCSKEVDDLGFRVYTIPAGKHSSGTFINHPDNSRISFQFILDESAYYETEIPENQDDVNKIYGMSDWRKTSKILYTSWLEIYKQRVRALLVTS